MASDDGPGIRDASRLLSRAAVLTSREISRLAVGYREIAAWEVLREPLPLRRRSIVDCEAAVRSVIGPERTAQIEQQASEAIARARADGRVSRVRSLIDWTYGQSAAAAIANAALAVEGGGAVHDADREILLRAWVRAVGPVPAVGTGSRGAPQVTGTTAEARPVPREQGEGRSFVPAVSGGLGVCLGLLLAYAAGGTGPVITVVAICVPAVISGFLVRRRGVISLAVAIGWLLIGLGIGVTVISAVVAAPLLIAQPPQTIGDAVITVLFVGGWVVMLSLIVGLVASAAFAIGFMLGRRFHQRRAGTDRGN
jgi:hypothetical protein